MVDIVRDVVDYGDAPEIYMNGFSRVTRISPGVLRITLYSERQDTDGAAERRAVVHLLCDLSSIEEDILRFQEALKEARETPSLRAVDRDKPIRRGTH